jgi:glycosyltransferase involved in cell wall biosynthesis
VKKAAQILRSHGLPVLLARAADKLRRNLVGYADARRRHREWTSTLRITGIGAPIHIVPTDAPLVSIVVTTSRIPAHTASALRAVVRHGDPEISCEIIVADDASHDEATAYFHACTGIRTALDSEGALSLARGRYVYLLSGDTIVTAGWLATLLRVFRERRDVDAVASQVRDRNGRLLGNVSPLDSRFRYVRAMEGGATASVLIEAQAVRTAGGVGNAGVLRTVYQPDSIVAQLGSLPTGSLPDGHAERAILVVDTFVPFDDRDAGSRRLLRIMHAMRELGYHAIFVSEDGVAHQPYASRLRQSGVELVEHGGSAGDCIRELSPRIDIAWICRPELCERYLPIVREAGMAVVYDTVDLHHLRLRRATAFSPQRNDWEAMEKRELHLASQADATVVTSDVERALLHEGGIDAYVVPVIEPLRPPSVSWAARRDLLFVGNYTHEPNVDAALWLCAEIMPLVWKRLPDVRVTLAGAEPTRAVRALANRRVVVRGYVPNLEPLFDDVRVVVAPLRYGAGVKGKIVQALAHGIPTVTTSVGAEGIGLIDGCDAAIADDAAAFADAVVALYTGAALWIATGAAALVAARRFTPEAVRPKVAAVLGALHVRRE